MADISVFYCEVNLSDQEFGAQCIGKANTGPVEHKGPNYGATKESARDGNLDVESMLAGMWCFQYCYLVLLAVSVVEQQPSMAAVWAGRLWWLWWEAGRS